MEGDLLFFEDKAPLERKAKNKRTVEQTNEVEDHSEEELQTKKSKTEEELLEKNEEELELERTLFGGVESIINNFGTDESFSSKSFRSVEDEEEEEKIEEKEKEAVWKDEEEEEEGEETEESKQYEQNLRKEFEKKSLIRKEWANVNEEKGEDEEDDEEDAEEIQRTTEERVGKGGRLNAKELNVERVTDANIGHPQSKITSVRFHPKNPLLFVASTDSRVQLFQIDGKNNPLVHHLQISGLKISTAEFGKNDQEIVLAGNRPWFYSYDISTGSILTHKDPSLTNFTKSWKELKVSSDDQYLSLLPYKSSILPLLSNKSKRFITKFTMPSPVSSSQFSPDGNYLTASTANGNIYRWDLRTRRCLDKFKDNDQLTTSLAYSHDGSYLASGAENGIVQIYRNGQEGKKFESPLKQLENLTTQIDEMKFNSDGQILAATTKLQGGKDGFRLFHAPSFHAFSDFPGGKSSCFIGGQVDSFDFSANSGFLATSSQSGKVHLYRLLDYSKA